MSTGRGCTGSGSGGGVVAKLTMVDLLALLATLPPRPERVNLIPSSCCELGQVYALAPQPEYGEPHPAVVMHPDDWKEIQQRFPDLPPAQILDALWQQAKARWEQERAQRG